MNEPAQWGKCSICKKGIGFGQDYYLCSVSSCKVKRKAIRFCSVQCWDEHRAVLRHRDAWAEDARAPSKEVSQGKNEGSESSTLSRAPARKIVKSASSVSTGSLQASAPNLLDANKIQADTLVVVSKVKKLIKEQSDFNTSQCCIDALTRKVVLECLRGIENAKKAERKTVMGRDIQ